MFFMAGAAASVLDFLGSMQSASGAKQNSAAGTAVPNQSPFDIASAADGGASTGATSAGATSAGSTPAGATSAPPNGSPGGCWSCSETMSMLLEVQGQSNTGAAGGTGGTAGSDVLGTLEQLLATLENQLGAGQTATGADGSPDSVQGRHGGDHRGGGIDQLLQALDSQSGTSRNVSNADGSTTTTITYADGSTVTMTSPASSSSNSSDPSGTSTASTSSGTGGGAVNPLERLIQQQAQMFAAATAGQNLSMMA